MDNDKKDINKLTDAQLILYLNNLPTYKLQQIFNATYTDIYTMAKNMKETRQKILDHILELQPGFKPGEIVHIKGTLATGIYVKPTSTQFSMIIYNGLKEIETHKLNHTNQIIDTENITESDVPLKKLIEKVCI